MGSEYSRRTTKDDWLDVIILSQLPDKEFSEVLRVDELTQWFSGSGDHERCAILCSSCEYTGASLLGEELLVLTFCEVAFVNETRDDMGIFEITGD